MSSKALLNLILPPAPVGKRILATFCDLILIFFLSLFVIGKLWIPIYHADVIVQFKLLLLEYAEQLQSGQFLLWRKHFIMVMLIIRSLGNVGA